jgi:hypothetical protein
MNKLLFRKKVYRVYVYNISGGVANIFYQSCVQIDNNQQVYEAHIQVPRCNSILKAEPGVKSSSHFIFIYVRVSTQTTVPRQLILMSMLSAVWARSCFWIGVSTLHQIFPHPLFLFTPSPTKLRWDIVTLPSVRPSFRLFVRNILVNTLESTSFNGF